MIAQEIAQMRPQLVHKMIITVTGPAGGVGISKVAGVTYLDIVRGWLSSQNPNSSFRPQDCPEGSALAKNSGAIEGAPENRGQGNHHSALPQEQLKALSRWGQSAQPTFQGPSACLSPMAIAPHGSSSKHPRFGARLRTASLIIYADSGHGRCSNSMEDSATRRSKFLATQQRPETRQANMKALVFKKGMAEQIHIAFAMRLGQCPGQDEFLVQVHALGFNPIDYSDSEGTFKTIFRFQRPARWASDLAGVRGRNWKSRALAQAGRCRLRQFFDRGTGALAEFARCPRARPRSNRQISTL